MRLILVSLAALILSLMGTGAPTPVFASASSEIPVVGDADCNFAVNPLDALGITTSVAGAGPAAQCLEFADVNCDGSVDLADAIQVLRHSASLPRTGAVGQCPPIGSASGLPPLVFSVDESVSVEPATIPGLNGGPPRALAAVVNDEGDRTLFVENEVIIVTDDLNALNAFLAGWGGTLLRTIDPANAGIDMPLIHQVRIDASGADPTQLADALRQLNADSWGQFDVSSQAGLELLAVAAGEAAAGMQIDLNWVAEGATLDNRQIREAASGPDQWDPNPFNWPYMNRGSAQDIGVADAWRLLKAAGKLGNKVDVAILDGGFSPNADFPAGFEMNGPVNQPNPATCTGGSSCPWHGTVVTAAAMGVPDNNFGVAGPAGPVARATLTQSPSLDLIEILQYIIVSLPSTAFPLPDVLNISAGVGIPRELCLTGICLAMDGITRGVRALGTLVFAAAGNDNKNVDAERCIDLLLGEVCYEKTTHIPCELDDGICVGGLNWNATTRNSASNYGTSDNNTVDIFGPMVQFSTPTPTAGIERRSCGTSCASPFVAGVAALIKAANPGLGAGSVEDIMMSTAHRNGGTHVKRWVNAYDAVLLTLGGNEPPELQIDFSNFTGNGGLPVYLSALVSDPEDRPTYGHPWNGLPTVTWTSSIDGVIANTPTPGLTMLPTPYGVHEITVTVTDSGNLTVSDKRTINLLNSAPVVNIVNPPDGGSFFDGQTINFRATSRDDNRASGTLDDAELVWTRHPVGNPVAVTQMGTGHLLQTSLPEGDWVIKLKGTDEVGAFSEDSITVDVGPVPTNFPPSVTINMPTNGQVFGCGPLPDFVPTITLAGTAVDPEDGALSGASLLWRKTVNGVTTDIGTGSPRQFKLDGIPMSTPFTITLIATDSANNSASDSVVISWTCIT